MKTIRYLKTVFLFFCCLILSLGVTACGDVRDQQSASTDEENGTGQSGTSGVYPEQGDPYKDITVPTMIISSAGAGRGESVDITLSVLNDPGIAAATFRIRYDEDILKLDGVEFNENFGGEFDEPGTLGNPVSVCWSHLGDIKSNGVFLKLRFTVKSEALTGSTANVSVECSDGDICNFNEDDIVFDLISGSVTVR